MQLPFSVYCIPIAFSSATGACNNTTSLWSVVSVNGITIVISMIRESVDRVITFEENLDCERKRVVKRSNILNKY